LRVLALACILAVNNFFGAVSLGAAPLPRRRRWAIVALFSLSDCALPLLGVVLGSRLARALGPAAAELGVSLILLTGVYLLFGVVRGRAGEALPAGTTGAARLVLMALALGLDNLGAAFGLGATGVPLPLTLLAFGGVTACATVCGLALGGVLQRQLPGRAARGVAGVVLLGVGCTMLVSRLPRN
jgi:putative Mn2+ efflux pump MntP